MSSESRECMSLLEIACGELAEGSGFGLGWQQALLVGLAGGRGAELTDGMCDGDNDKVVV